MTAHLRRRALALPAGADRRATAEVLLWPPLTPSSPPQNSYVESFSGRMRDELLNESVLRPRSCSQRISEADDYNHIRPLGYQAPAGYAGIIATTGSKMKASPFRRLLKSCRLAYPNRRGCNRQ
ncbi:integrase core domain-containing protein [Rhizobium esperanzae]|uniref:integrase core domain-containing protein n=1 Tax=Rhizobium esperanzae TaxID=1967781 RepID=UPI003D7C1C8C